MRGWGSSTLGAPRQLIRSRIVEQGGPVAAWRRASCRFGLDRALRVVTVPGASSTSVAESGCREYVDLMGSAGSVATVTSTLRGRLQRGLVVADIDAVIGSVSVTTVRPAEFRARPSGPSQLNLALHHVLPDRARSESSFALVLRYLITAFGTDTRADEMMIGAAVIELAEHPVITVAGERLAASLVPLGPVEWSRLWRSIGVSHRLERDVRGEPADAGLRTRGRVAHRPPLTGPDSTPTLAIMNDAEQRSLDLVQRLIVSALLVVVLGAPTVALAGYGVFGSAVETGGPDRTRRPQRRRRTAGRRRHQRDQPPPALRPHPAHRPAPRRHRLLPDPPLGPPHPVSLGSSFSVP